MTNLTDLSTISSDTTMMRTPSPPPSWITIDEWVPTEGSISSLEEGEIRSEWSEDSHPELQLSDEEREPTRRMAADASHAPLQADTFSINSDSSLSNSSVFDFEREREMPYFQPMVNWLMNSQQSGTKIKSVYTQTYVKEAHCPLVSYWEERMTGDEKVRAFLRISVPLEEQTGNNHSKDEEDDATMTNSSLDDASTVTVKAEVRGGSLTPPIRVSHSVKAEFKSLPSPVPAFRRTSLSPSSSSSPSSPSR